MAQLAQPNFQALRERLTAASQEIALIPNFAVTLAQLAQQQAQQQAALAQLAQQQAQQHAELIQRLDGIVATQQRLPMQLRNAVASLDAPLIYPLGVEIGPGFPVTKNDLLTLTGKSSVKL
ncbi:hypothetical protein AX14_008784 [Amanita brunnescens Koide BX004]|nr:hypothetical protein AX14_008784 [Amanita brunnescens Koide BX004]